MYLKQVQYNSNSPNMAKKADILKSESMTAWQHIIMSEFIQCLNYAKYLNK